jgi:DNA repair protein RecN (Recombination protein N)
MLRITFYFCITILIRMLKSLSIKNYALIKELVIQPDAGLNIITGETGAGKSIMLGALGLLMGNRADSKALFNEEEKCVIEGVFELEVLNLKAFFEAMDIDYDPTTIIRREIAANGKSRAFVNDQPVTLDVLKELGDKLMDIHSQHDTLQLGSNTFQLAILDTFTQNSQQIEEFSEAFKTFKKAEKEYAELLAKAELLKKEFDYNSFLLNELSQVKLEDIHQAELEEEQKVLENAEEIKRKLSQAYEYLNHAEMPALELLKDASLTVGSIASLSEKYAHLRDRLNSSLIELLDISHELEVENSKVDTDNTRLEAVTDILNNLYKLQKKHSAETTLELISIRNDLYEKVETVLNLSEDLQKLEKRKNETQENALHAAMALSSSRKKEISSLQNQIITILQDLGMPNAVFGIHLEEKPMSAEGIDGISFRFSANKGSSPKPLKDVASGGEFSRVMLALKYILAQKSQLPTIIFDEIDTGISGEVAVKVGNLLKDMAKVLQVITITHLPQIAGKGLSHFYVFKDNSEAKTVSKMKKLSTEERIYEIATMIGGQNPSDSAINSAKELLSV